jgi:hypothetical protein
MKKVFLMLAFAGLVGSVSASVNNDDKDKGKKECKKETKSCCKEKAGAEGKACSGDAKAGEKKACCKDKHASTEAKPAETK